MADSVTPVPREAPPGRRWWQRLPFLLLVGVAPLPFGLYFLGFIAIALLLSDSTREPEVRAGGSVLLFWWAYSFREGDTSPYFGALLLAIAAVLMVRGVRRRLERGWRAAWAPAVGALLAVAMGVVVFVPYGYRGFDVTREAAAERVFEERATHPWKGIRATSYLVERGRLRVIHKPVWYVAVFEKNATVDKTADKQPCFSRREVWRVDALDGTVTRATYDEASVGDDPCLPIRMGTEADLLPAPAP